MNPEPATVNEPLLHRVCGEFSEMPGLRLTLSQAQRLWGLDEETCRWILDSLVEAKFLCQPRFDTYGRLTDGPVANTQLRIAKAQVDGDSTPR